MKITRRLIAGILLGGLVLTAGFLGLAWYSAEAFGTVISTHGFIALGLGVFLTLMTSALFIILLVHSRRAGYDEEAHDTAETMTGRRSPDED
jgi:membrane protein implicated in regulation of membrane protease activity